MKYEIGKIIAQEYQQRRARSLQKSQDDIDAVYRIHPKLLDIDRQVTLENALQAISIMKDGIPREDSEKKSQLLFERKDYLATRRIPSDFDSPKYSCPLCHDTGYLLAGPKGFCSCYQQLLIPLLLKNSNFKNLSKYRFSQFDISLFSDESDPKRYQTVISPRKQLEGIRKAAAAFVDHFDAENTRSLFFLGKPGTGKTFMSGCIANELLMQGKSILYFSSPELFENITEFRTLSNSFAPDPERFENASRIYQCILDCDLFILDDLGTETIHANRQPELLNIMNHRMDSNRKMIISTNLEASSLSSLYDERVLSRIYGGFSVWKFYGNDLRHAARTRE
jgi:DNA replication protein DnaC